MNLNHQITENFKLSEFVLSDFYNEEQQQRVINSLTPQAICNIQELAENLQIIRDEINQPIRIKNTTNIAIKYTSVSSVFLLKNNLITTTTPANHTSNQVNILLIIRYLIIL